MKRIFIVSLLVCLLLSSCVQAPSIAPTQRPATQPPVTQVPLPSLSADPSPTAAPPTAAPPTPAPPTPTPEIWSSLPVITDAPYHYENTSVYHSENDFLTSQVAFGADTRWQVNLSIGKLADLVQSPSSGFSVYSLSQNEVSEGQARPWLILAYQDGVWNLAYAPVSGASFSFWQGFPELTNPEQHFTLEITDSGKHLALANDSGFAFQHDFIEPLFAGAKSVFAATQTGPGCSLTISHLVVRQKQTGQQATAPIASAETWSSLPVIEGTPYRYDNPTASFKGEDFLTSRAPFNGDTRFLVDLSAGKLSDAAGPASSGFSVFSLRQNEVSEGQARPWLLLTYQDNLWNVAYAPVSGANFTLWQGFPELTDPEQHFTLEITQSGKHLSLANDSGFTFQHDFIEPLFAGAETLYAALQAGPGSSLTISRLTLQQKRATAQQAGEPASPPEANGQAPAPAATGNGQPQYIFHVSPTGNDANPGTEAAPFQTITRARDAVRQVNATMSGPIEVILHGGVYPILKPVQLGAQDSGQNGFTITYRAADGELPLLSGGVALAGWQPVAGSSLWKTALPAGVGQFRQLYVNGQRARRAAAEKTITGTRYAPGENGDKDGIVVPAARISNFAHPQDLELHWIYDWKDMRLPVRDLTTKGAEKTIWMDQPYYARALDMGRLNPPWFPAYNVPFYLENALELLDQPGEWYANFDTGEVFYWPREREDMASASAIVPQAQSLLEVSGVPFLNQVHDLVFEGLGFAYAGWTAPNLVGSFGWQGQVQMSTGATLMTPAHVTVSAAARVRFEKNRFEHLGAAGIFVGSNTQQVTVQGNLFYDISEAAIIVGHWEDDYLGASPYRSQARDTIIANNLIDSAGAEYWGAAGINAYYVANLQIIHNEITHLPYSGISLGWGWRDTLDSTTSHDNHVASNLITDYMQRARDGGGIYTLGQMPGTRIENNVFRRMKGDYGCLYPDAGSAHITYNNNVCDTVPFWLHQPDDQSEDLQISNTYTNVAATIKNSTKKIDISGTKIVKGQNWPPEAQAIIAQAGLEPAFQYLREWLAGEQ